MRGKVSRTSAMNGFDQALATINQMSNSIIYRAATQARFA